MKKPSLQLFYLISSFLMIIGLLFYGASRLLAFYQSGAENQEIVMLDTKSVNTYYQPKLSWKMPISNEGRVIEANTLQKISRDYVASYYHQFQALKTGDPIGLHDYYTEKARTHLEELVAWNSENNQTLSGTTIEHQAQLDFYSEDGTIASLTDQVISYQKTAIGDETKTMSYDTSSYRSMLLLEDNFWRIRHKVKTEIPNLFEEVTSDSLADYIDGSRFYVEGTEFIIKGINYYPQNHPWELMWENFDSIDFQSDFQLLKTMGFNTIRIFVPFQHFGGASPNQSELLKLKTLMNLADESELKVIVTLFDFFLGYRLEEWTLSDRHAEGVVNTIKDHSALLAWDLKNEPDLDFEQSGKIEVQEWLKFISKRIKGYDPNTFITIGWSQPEVSPLVEDEIDFYSFHFYRDPVELDAYLEKNKFTKPLFLGETGMHSFKSWWYPIGNSEKEQKNYYSQITKLLEKHDLNYAFWT
ncbi:MAG: cellulase family glycosylhydrolase, partial [Ekhidna sp.]